MRVLLVTELMPATDAAEITGGVEARTFYVGRELAERHDVSIIAERTDGTRWDPASIVSLPRRVRFLSKALMHGIRSDCDVVDGSNLVVFPIAWFLARCRRRPVVFWYPDVLIGQWRAGGFGMTGWLGEAVEKLVLKMPVDRYIAISNSTARKLAAQGVAPERITVVPCGYDPGAVEAAREMLPQVANGGAPGSEKPTLTVVGRLVNYKPMNVVIRALAQLADRHPDVQLEIVGQGPEHDRLAQLAETLGVAERVRFTGHVAAHVDVLRRVAASSVFVSASEVEGFGIVVVEAMALGVPYLVADNEAHTEVTAGGVGGELFRRGDAEDLAQRLDALLHDGARRAALGRQGQAYAAAHYRWADAARATEAVYADVIAARRARR